MSKSSITDLKSHSSNSIAAISSETLAMSPKLPTKTQSFDDRECLHSSTTSVVTPIESNASCNKGIDCTKPGETTGHELNKSSENISLHCEINEPNANIRQENSSAIHLNASDTNLEAPSAMLSDGAKVRSESLTLSASPPKITVMCAPCTEDVLAESAAQNAEKIECDVSDSEEIAQNIITTVEPTNIDVGKRKSSPSPITAHDTTNLQLSLDVKKTDDIPVQQEDLSPSMDEYEECNPTSGDYLYDTITGETLVPGCVAPAPTPAPLNAFAPLAEIEVDPPDDEMSVSGIEKPTEINTDPVNITDAESTAKQQSQTSRQTKKKKQKSTDKGNGFHEN